MITTFTYAPDDYVDLGLAGEHPIVYKADIVEDVYFEGVERRSVTIVSAKVAIKYGVVTHYLEIVSRVADDSDLQNEIYNAFVEDRSERHLQRLEPA